jgi:Flp pilus assembly protein TadD
MAIAITNKLTDVIVNGSEKRANSALDDLLKHPVLDVAPLSILGKALMEKARFGMAARIFAKWTDLRPKDPMPWTNLGACLYRLRKNTDAKAILLHAISLDPNYALSRINLGGVLQELGENHANLENALEVVRIDPKLPLAHNNLGSALADFGMFEAAKHSFETALILDPNNEFALSNVAKMNSSLGDTLVAIEQFETLVTHLERTKSTRLELNKVHLSFEYLKVGRLDKAWEYYDLGFSKMLPIKMSRTPAREFSVPRWDGRRLTKNQRLLVWREQGIGDEVMFGSCLPELAGLDAQVTIECDDRLIETYKRSFPDFVIRRQSFDPSKSMQAQITDYDYHIPVGSLCRLYRSKIENFENSRPFIKVDERRRADFAMRLEPYRDKRLIGICWRSGMLSALRNNSYTSLVDWAPIFSLPNAVFVNLQYGDCEEELLEAEQIHGIKVVRWADLDLKNDLDGVFALMSNLETVVSVGTAVIPFAGAVGTNAILLTHPSWTSLGQPDTYPWYPGVKPLFAELNQPVSSVLPVATKLLAGISD